MSELSPNSALMSALPDKVLIWLEINYRRPIVVSVFGPYTNSGHDQQLLRDKLYELCNRENISRQTIDNAMDPHLRRLDRLHMSNTQGKWVFTIHAG
jgi:hypothetical protein